MSDGHTEAGSWVVKLELTEDQVQQLIRSMETARLIDNGAVGEETMEQTARKAFLQEILDELYNEVLKQKEAHEAKTGQEE